MFLRGLALSIILCAASARAQTALSASHLASPATESVLVSSGSARDTTAAVVSLQARARRLPSVASVQGPREVPALSRSGGRLQLVQVQLRGDPGHDRHHRGRLERDEGAEGEQAAGQAGVAAREEPGLAMSFGHGPAHHDAL